MCIPIKHAYTVHITGIHIPFSPTTKPVFAKWIEIYMIPILQNTAYFFFISQRPSHFFTPINSLTKPHNIYYMCYFIK